MTPQIHTDNERPGYDQPIQDIVNYVFDYEVTSTKAWERAKLALLDALGCAVATAASNKEAQCLIGPFIPGSQFPRGARVVGTNFELDPVKAAFDNGLLIRYLDFNDGFPGSEWGHPSDNLGALVSVLDWLSRAHASAPLNQATSETKASSSPTNFTGPPRTVRTLLEAQIKAYEIQGCFQVRNSFNAVGLDHTILVKVASTAVVSWLIGLTRDQAFAAVSQAWQDGHPLRTYRQAPNAGPRKGWAAGDACMRAVHLALITRAGQPGSPTVLTAPRWGFYSVLFKDQVFDMPKPYGSWVAENIFFKIIAAEGHGITAVYAALQLSTKLAAAGLRPDSSIARIRVRTHSAAATIIDKVGTLHNPADRDHCIQYLIAVTLLKNAVVETGDYEDGSPWASDPRVDRLREKVELYEDPQLTRDYYDPKLRSPASGLTIELTDGVVLDEVLVQYVAGHPLWPGSEEAVHSKFRKNMLIAFPGSDRDEASKKALDVADMPVHAFVNLFVKDPKPNL